LLGFPDAINKGYYIKPENNVVDLILEAGKEENANKPYFLILDEMNLSHVERYFADFLSTMESEEEPMYLHSPDDWIDDMPATIKLPKNLFIIGTVNVDETTYMFSPKVLDRAHVIEFRVSDEEMENFLKEPSKPDLETLKGLGKEMASDFILKSQTEISEFEDLSEIKTVLLDFFKELKKVGAEFG
jgi:5-methylcytosine-specific restriction protein B